MKLLAVPFLLACLALTSASNVCEPEDTPTCDPNDCVAPDCVCSNTVPEIPELGSNTKVTDLPMVIYGPAQFCQL